MGAQDIGRVGYPPDRGAHAPHLEEVPLIALVPLALLLSAGATPETASWAEATTAASAAPAPAPAPVTCGTELFRIARSTNANELVYAAQLDASGRLDPDDPLVVYWLMNAEDGHREGLNILEKTLAYGFSTDQISGGVFRVVLKAKKDRPVLLGISRGCPTALIQIGGRSAQLRRIFVQTSSGGVIPGVAHVDLVGLDPQTGHEVKERIFPD
jgi:hypothetical protein